MIKKITPYLHGLKTANNIEAAYEQFLNDASNTDAIGLRNSLLNRLHRSAPKIATLCRTCYKKLSSVVHCAGQSFRTLHAAQKFIDMIIEIPKLSHDEKLIIEKMTEVLYP